MGRWESFELPWAREDWLWNRRVGRTSCIRPNRRWRGTRKTCNRTEPLGIHCKSPGPISIEMASCPASSAGPAPPCLNTWRICKQWAMGNGPGANQLLGHLSGGKSNIISVNHRWGEQNTLNWPVDVFQGEVRFRLIAMNDYLFTTWIRLWSFIIGWLSTIRVLGGGERGGEETDLGPIYNSGNLSFVSFSFMAGSDLTIRLDFDTGNWNLRYWAIEFPEEGSQNSGAGFHPIDGIVHPVPSSKRAGWRRGGDM